MTVVQHRRDLQALLAVREGRRSVLSRRLTDSRARDTVAGRSCMLCGYAQFVRLSRDLESMGAPTFHLQLLGSVYHVLFRLGRDEKRYEAVLRADL